MSTTFDTLLDAGLILTFLVAIAVFLQFIQRQRLVRDLQALTADMKLAENVARIGYWSRPANSEISTWSDGMFEIFEQDPRTFIPTRETTHNLFLPGDWEEVVGLSEAVMAGRKGGEVEVRVRTPSGKIKDVLVVTRGRVNKAEKVQSLFGIIADITARKAAERGARDREEQLQRAVSAMGAAIWDWDPGTDRLFAGPRFAEILGLDPQSFNPTMALHHQLCHPDDLKMVQDAFRRSVRTGDPYAIEYRMRHSAGHYVWVDSRGRVVTYDGDRPVRAIGTVVEVTERQEAKEELRRSRESLELAMAASQAGHFDLSAKEAYWSPRALEILGLSDSEVRPTASTLSQLIHPDDLPEFLANREEFVMRDVPLDAQVRIKRGTGQYIWVHVRAMRLRNASGEAHRTIGIIRDVSASMQAQQALTDSERKFRYLIEGSLQGVLIMRELRPAFCNDAAAKIYGYERASDLIAHGNMLDHVAPERREDAKGDWERALRRELDAKARRVKIVDRGGRVRFIEVVERLIQWEGAPARQLVILDVTEQEMFQAKLRASEERFRLLADNVSDVITLYDQDQVLRYVSPSIERVAGYKPEEVEGRDLFELSMAEDKPSPEARALLAREPVLGVNVWRMRRKDGTPIWVESTSTRVAPVQGQRGYSIVSALRNVTERVERESELGAARDRLKNQADELTILAQNLEMERERAEQANSAKSQFLAMMSHELRTPMTGVLGMADLLLMSKLSGEQQELTELLKRSARSLLDLLNDVLDFSKIEANQLAIESIPFNLTEVLADVVNLFTTNANEKGVNLDQKLPSKYWSVVKGDPKRLRQVLSNLVGNALKFTEMGGVTIGFEQLSAPGNAVKLKFSVSDTGIGISEADAAKLFKPFVQADLSTSRKYGGTGLGLAISKSLVEGMGGEITMTSVVGAGSTFTFTVVVEPDRGVPQVDAKAAAAPQRRELTRDASAVVPRKILLAEDNQTSRYLISTMLTRFGHTVDAVENGAEAVAAARQTAYDVILMDMQMPVMDGPEATREIRKFKAGRGKVPVIALTADVIASHRSSYFAAGVDAIVGKPVNWTELSEEIERQMVKTGAAADGNAKSGSKPAATSDRDPLLDEKALGALADALGEDVLAPMLLTFNANMHKYQSDLAAATASGDLKQAKRTAHALKGLCAQFGAWRASNLAKFIEMDVGNVADITPLLPGLGDAIVATERALIDRQARVKAAS